MSNVSWTLFYKLVSEPDLRLTKEELEEVVHRTVNVYRTTFCVVASNTLRITQHYIARCVMPVSTDLTTARSVVLRENSVARGTVS